MLYVLAHTNKANAWITQFPRLYAYPKIPDQSGEKLVVLDSGAYALSLQGRQMDGEHIANLAKHYAKHYPAHGFCVAPDEFKNPDTSMRNFRDWHALHKTPVAPVLQMTGKQRFDAYAVKEQLTFYKKYQLPKVGGVPVICFSNAGWRAIDFDKHIQALKLAIKIVFAKQAIWLHNLGAGWDLADIKEWANYKIFSSTDSIAWYTDAERGKAWGDYDGDLLYNNALASQYP